MIIEGLNQEKVLELSNLKKDSKEIRKFRLDSYAKFSNLDMPKFGPEVNIDFSKIIYYKSNIEKMGSNWNSLSCSIKQEFNDLGVIESEKKLDGMGVQYESEVIYHNMLEELKNKNVIFTSIEEGLNKYPQIALKYFSKIVANDENKFTALNGSVFSGGSFIYIPKNTKLDRPLQSYFRINSNNLGQFERTLIIVDDNSELHYIEGCTARKNLDQNLHAAVVEIYVGKNSKCRYSTIQNWSTKVLNLVTKRALVSENGTMEWIDGNIGSSVTMKYPCSVLKGDNSKGTCITISVAKENQQQDSGAKMIHLGKNTSSNIISKSISSKGGNATYRGKVFIDENACSSSSSVKCDTLILDDISKSDTFPINICNNDSSSILHEATVSKISEENLYYLMSRGLSREKAVELVVLGFAEKFREELPVEYAVELNQLLKENF